MSLDRAANHTNILKAANNKVIVPKKMKRKITVSVSTEVKGNSKGEVFVTIKDTGQGIHPEIESRLFSKFASKLFQGTGLGLFIAKRVLLHKSFISSYLIYPSTSS